MTQTKLTSPKIKGRIQIKTLPENYRLRTTVYDNVRDTKADRDRKRFR